MRVEGAGCTVTSLKRKLQTQCPTAEILVIVVCLYLSYPCSCSLNTQKQEKIMCGSNFECSKVCINGLSIKHLFTHIATHCKPPCRPGCCAARSSAKSDLFFGPWSLVSVWVPSVGEDMGALSDVNVTLVLYSFSSGIMQLIPNPS